MISPWTTSRQSDRIQSYLQDSDLCRDRSSVVLCCSTLSGTQTTKENQIIIKYLLLYREEMRVLILENIRSAYNVGNIIRTADALGWQVRLT